MRQSWLAQHLYLIIIRSNSQGESHGEGLVVGAGLEAAMAAEVVCLPLEVAQQAGHVRVRGPVRGLPVDVVPEVGVGHHENTKEGRIISFVCFKD